MVDWQVTATTVNCECVADEVTILVYKDGTVKCTGYNKYVSQATEKMIKTRKKQLGCDFKCEGPECRQMIEYRDRLFREDSAKQNIV